MLQSEDRVLLLDAAMGTRLIHAGVLTTGEYAYMCTARNPYAVAKCHRRDVAAGADCVLTNTFGGHRLSDGKTIAGCDAREIHVRAVRLARDAAGPERYILGSMTASVYEDALRRQGELLLEAGADGLALETMRAAAARDCVAALRKRIAAPILVSLQVDQATADRELARLGELEIDALGINCVPVSEVEPWLERLRAVYAGPLLVEPNGSRRDGPGAFAAALASWIGQGARLVGGCCGTTERHVAALRRALDRAQAPVSSERR
jgi:5-methyltetrahydrofolate--homocysteine methyltransferase